MESRDERKRRAKAKELALKQAVSEAFKREAAKPEPIQDYSRPWCIAGLQRIHDKSGVVHSRAGKRQLITREPALVEPLKVDGIDGRGHSHKTWLTGRDKRIDRTRPVTGKSGA